MPPGSPAGGNGEAGAAGAAGAGDGVGDGRRGFGDPAIGDGVGLGACGAAGDGRTVSALLRQKTSVT
jgi:hypothetical protein